MGIFTRTWTISDIMSASGDRPQKAGACSVEFVGKQYELKPETLPDKLKSLLRRSQVHTYYIIFKFKVTSETGHTHNVLIRTLPKADMGGPVQIYCDCNDFKYRCAYGLQQHGALYRSPKTDTKLGEAITTAPKRSGSTLCKHALAAITELTSNFNAYLG